MRWLLAVSIVAACSSAPPTTTQHVPSAQPLRRDPALALLERAADLDGAIVGHSDAPTVAFVFASWCEHCHTELALLAALRVRHPTIRIVGVNYRGHEEYDHRGNALAVRAYVARYAPWLRVVPVDDHIFDALGAPPKVPTMYAYDRTGLRVAVFDRRERPMPDAGELDALFASLGS